MIVTKLVQEKENIYNESFDRFGYFSLLILLNKYEREERFDDCQIIYNVLKNKKEKLKINIPLKYYDGIFDDYKGAFNEVGLSGNTALKNLSNYLFEIEQRISKIPHNAFS